MLFEVSDMGFPNIAFEAIFMTPRYYNLKETDKKEFMVEASLIEEHIIKEEHFIDALLRIIDNSKNEYERICIVIIGKSFQLQNSQINDWVTNLLKDPNDAFLDFVIKPHNYKLKKIILKTSKEQTEDLNKKLSHIKKWSTTKQIGLIIDSLATENSQETICNDYRLIKGRFLKYLQNFCNDNKKYLEDRIENILIHEYGDMSYTFPKYISDLKDFFTESRTASIKNFINESFPEIFGGIQDDLEKMDDIAWRLNSRMASGERLFHYVKHLVPKKISNEKQRKFRKPIDRVSYMESEDIKKEIANQYATLLNIVQKIKLLKKIKDEKTKDPIFPINQLKIFWDDWEERHSPKTIRKQGHICVWDKIISDKKTAGDIAAETLAFFYDKKSETIKGYHHNRGTISEQVFAKILPKTNETWVE